MIREKKPLRRAQGTPEPAPLRPIVPPEIPQAPAPFTAREHVAAFIRLYWFLGVILITILFFGVLLLILTKESKRPPVIEELNLDASTQATSDEPSAREATLSVSSFPYGATVLLDLDTVGTAPISSHVVSPGLYLLSLRLPEYAPVDTLVNLAANANRRLFFNLKPLNVPAEAASTRSGTASQYERPAQGERAQREPASSERSAAQRRPSPEQTPAETRPPPALGSLTLTTEPPGAVTLLNGRPIGRTPVTERNLAPGSYEVTFSLDGYEAITRSLTLRENEAASHGTMLVVSEGTLSVLVRPWGSIFIDGVLHKRDTDVQFQTALPVGRHVVKAVHPTLGEIAREVTVERARESHLVLEFRTN